MNRMNWSGVSAVAAAVLSLACGGAQANDEKEPKLTGYTCCNLHFEGDWISDANWGIQAMIPAGTPIKVLDYGRYRFAVEIDGKPMRIGQEYGRNETLAQLARKIVVDKDPKTRIAAWPAPVREAVRFGKVITGMTHEQVIASLGYPPAHQTPSLDAPQWKYWHTRFASFIVVWDDKNRLKDVLADGGTRATVMLQSRN